jgi:hypothetical protein
VINADVMEVLKLAAAVVVGGAGVHATQLTKAKADGKAEGASAAEHKALSDRVAALEDQHDELLRHVNERATKADVQSMAAQIITQMDARFSNMIALITARLP